jgi:hypothetical protein
VCSDKNGRSGYKKERGMKKLVVLLVMLALVMPAFADDAKVLPAGVLRTYLTPSYSFASQSFDADGDKVDLPASEGGAVSFINLGAAFEYGVNDWITAAVQWAPGVNVSSTFDDNDDLSANGMFEAFVGAKFQIVGEKAPVALSNARVAFAPGVMVPLAFGYDAEEEATNVLNSEAYNVLPANNVFGFGGRFYADYIVNKSVFLNLYSEFKYFLPKAGEDDFTQQVTKVYTESPSVSYTLPDEINYGYELTVEFEPHYATMFSDGVELSLGLPLAYVITPDTEIDGVSQDNASSLLKVSPSVSAFFMKSPLPIEFKLGYTYPILGENTNVLNTVVAQIKAYAKF